MYQSQIAELKQDIIENGGFEYLISADFKGDPSYVITSDCYSEIGLPRCKVAFNDVLNYFPNRLLNDDHKERRVIIKKFQKEIEIISERYLIESKFLESKVGQYIKANDAMIWNEIIKLLKK